MHTHANREKHLRGDSGVSCKVYGEREIVGANVILLQAQKFSSRVTKVFFFFNDTLPAVCLYTWSRLWRCCGY